MSRDSILDEAEQKSDQSESENDSSTGSEQEENTENSERTRLTQRVPDDLLDDIDEVKKQFHFSSRNETINFMLSNAADDLLDE